MSELRNKVKTILINEAASIDGISKQLAYLIDQQKMEWLKKLIEDQREFFPPATEHHEDYQGFHLALDMLLTVAEKSLEEK